LSAIATTFVWRQNTTAFLAIAAPVAPPVRVAPTLVVITSRVPVIAHLPFGKVNWAIGWSKVAEATATVLITGSIIAPTAPAG
jgi:uncharacterized membrane protein